MGLSEAQRTILADANQNFTHLSEVDLEMIAAGERPLAAVSLDELVEFLQIANILYRGGESLISDRKYDFLFVKELESRAPEHPFLHAVEPEAAADSKTVELPVRMLSTEKAYDFETVERWAGRVEKAAQECGVDFTGLLLRLTPKLDGFAAYDDGEMLYTRGDGRRGTNITRVFDRGLQVARGGQRGLGAGEIVVSRSYFQSQLADFFDNSRNFQASLIKEKELDAPACEAIKLGEAVFFPFVLLPNWQGSWQQLAADFDAIVDEVWDKLDFDIDGVVLEVVDDQVKQHMGATRHHHRWQIAFKRNTETAKVKVLQVIPQTSRSGRVNPVAELEPTRLSGALIKRATAHHYRMVVDNGIGPGALIRLSRSGEVIPKIEEVLVPAEPSVPQSCPSCGGKLLWEKDFLVCVNNMNCPAQITHAIEHFFKTIGNIDGFGPSSIKKMYEGGIRSVPEIYRLGTEQFEELGFGPKQAENMVGQLQRSLSEPIEDWRFLAAFGIFRMGMGNCEKLLEHYSLLQIFDLTETEIGAIKGFADKTAEGVVSGLAATAEFFWEMYGMGFDLTLTPVSTSGEKTDDGVLTGKLIVFTGTMQHGSREEMKTQARNCGARVGSSITGKTDMLVCGEKVGATKLAKAESLGVRILSESEYLALLRQ
ncbi:MAG: BRCT domain-containing protein [Desulforhopalus sp.]